MSQDGEKGLTWENKLAENESSSALARMVCRSDIVVCRNARRRLRMSLRVTSAARVAWGGRAMSLRALEGSAIALSFDLRRRG
jgi:hypothetical protein